MPATAASLIRALAGRRQAAGSIQKPKVESSPAVGPGFDFLDFSWIREEQIMGSPHFDELRRFIKPDRRREFEKFYD